MNRHECLPLDGRAPGGGDDAEVCGVAAALEQGSPFPGGDGQRARGGAVPIAAGEGAGPFRRLVIRGATLIDGSGAPPRGPVDIVVAGNRIESIRGAGTPGLPLRQQREPRDADHEIDATGMYVLPGFVDVHGHNGDPDKAPNATYGYRSGSPTASHRGRVPSISATRRCRAATAAQRRQPIVRTQALRLSLGRRLARTAPSRRPIRAEPSSLGRRSAASTASSCSTLSLRHHRGGHSGGSPAPPRHRRPSRAWRRRRCQRRSAAAIGLHSVTLSTAISRAC